LLAWRIELHFAALSRKERGQFQRDIVIARDTQRSR
jgi:hypothetical protein